MLIGGEPFVCRTETPKGAETWQALTLIRMCKFWKTKHTNLIWKIWHLFSGKSMNMHSLLRKASGSVEAFIPLPYTKGKGHCCDECAKGKRGATAPLLEPVHHPPISTSTLHYSNGDSGNINTQRSTIDTTYKIKEQTMYNV